jgi:hypothetical protein
LVIADYFFGESCCSLPGLFLLKLMESRKRILKVIKMPGNGWRNYYLSLHLVEKG